jgi:hypothetical protein
MLPPTLVALQHQFRKAEVLFFDLYLHFSIYSDFLSIPWILSAGAYTSRDRGTQVVPRTRDPSVGIRGPFKCALTLTSTAIPS